MKLKTKKLSANNRNMLDMAIRIDTKNTLIYLHGVSKTTGEDQWYESKFKYTNASALNVFYNGEYKTVFNKGMAKSTTTNWI